MGMGGKLRESGIDTIGDVPWGTHFCQFYKTKKDLIDILVPYSKQDWKIMNFAYGLHHKSLMYRRQKRP
jgi:hypothetical protein